MSFSTRQFAHAFKTRAEDQAAIVAAKERFLANPEAVMRSPPGVVRTEILHSWKRSLDAGVDPYDDAPLPSEKPSGTTDLERVVEAHRGDIERDLDGTNAWVIVMDRHGREIGTVMGADEDVRGAASVGASHGGVFREEVAGSNGAAMALERLDAFAVVGAEHFRWVSHNLVTVGASVRDPVGRVVGAVSTVGRVADAHPVLLPLARGIARTISDAILQHSHDGEHALFAEFLRSTTRPSRPVVAVGEDLLLLNAAARQLLAGGTALDAVAARAKDQVRDAPRSTGRVNVAGVEHELRTVAVQTTGAIAKLARVSPVRLDTAPGTRLRRARASGTGVLVRGESGSGRAHLIAGVAGEVHELTAAEVEAALAEPTAMHDVLGDVDATVLMRDVDELGHGSRIRLAALLRGARAWIVGTSSPAWTSAELLDALPVIVDHPALRERSHEFAELAESFLVSLGPDRVRLAPDALSVLGRLDWPGNLRQLRSVLSTAATHAPGGVIELAHLPASIIEEARSSPRSSSLASMRRRLLIDALRQADWDREAAAERLGISRATVYRQLKSLGIRVPARRR